MTSNSLKKVSVFILIVGILCTCLFGCTDKPASGNDVISTTESTTKGEESTTIGDESGNEDNSSVHKEKSPVKKDDETTTKKKTIEKVSTTKKVDKETTTKGTTTTEPTTEAYTPTPLVPLTAEQKLKVKQDYLEFYNETELTIDDVYIRDYFGMYNECQVMLLSGIYPDAIYEINIAGYDFIFSQLREMDVYRNGEFTTLSTAYENGWISKDDVRDIHYYYSSAYKYLY